MNEFEKQSIALQREKNEILNDLVKEIRKNTDVLSVVQESINDLATTLSEDLEFIRDGIEKLTKKF